MPLDFQIRRPILALQPNGAYRAAAKIIANAPLVANELSLIEIKTFSNSGNPINNITYRSTEVATFVNGVNDGEFINIIKGDVPVFSYYDLMAEGNGGYKVEISMTQSNGSQTTRSMDVMLKGGNPASQSFLQYIKNVFEIEFGWDAQDVYDYVTPQSFWGQSNGGGSYVGGEIFSWYDEYVEMGGNQPQPSTESIVEALSGEILGCVVTQNSITQTHGFATLDDGSCEPSCNNTSATILNSQIQEWGQAYIDELDGDQITCLVDYGYGDPTGGSNPEPTQPFDEEAVADQFFDYLQDEFGFNDCLPEDWIDYLVYGVDGAPWWDANEYLYEENYEGEGLNSSSALDVVISFIVQNPQQYPLCIQNVTTPDEPSYVEGCTYSDATNYNPQADFDDGSCIYPDDPTPLAGCTYSDATNYNPNAEVDDGSCVYPEDPTYVEGCVYPDATNYNPAAQVDDGSCVFPEDVFGCTDVNATNYNPNANVNDGTCEFEILGCTDSSANNYNSSANTDDGSCTYDIQGCTDPSANNYLDTATVNDGSCEYTQGPISGCQDPMAYNYNPSATTGGTENCQYAITEGEGNPYTGDATDLITTLGLTNNQYITLINDTIGLIQELQTELDNCPEDQTGTITDLNNQISELQEELETLSGVEGMLNAVENTISNIASSPCNLTDPTTDALFAAMTAANVNGDTISALETLCQANIGVTSQEYNTLLADINAVYGIIGGIYENLVDVNNPAGYLYDYSQGNYENQVGGFLSQLYGTTGSLTQQTGNIETVLDGIENAITNLQNVTPEDGISQADLDAVQSQLDTAVAEVNEIASMLSSPANYTAENVATASDNLTNMINSLNEALSTLWLQNPSYAALQEQIQNAIDTLTTALNTGNYANIGSLQGIEAYATAVNQVVNQLASVTPQDPTLTATQQDVDDAYNLGFSEGAESVDITSDNDAVEEAAYNSGYADGAASVTPEDGITELDVDAAYAQGLLDGAASVTPEDGINQADVDAAYALGLEEGAASVDITSNDEAVYTQGYNDGVASVDITTDNQGAFDEGAASVDITSNDDAVYLQGYEDGQNDITFLQSSYDQGFGEGVASVDITTDNQGAFDEGYTAGYGDGAGQTDNEQVNELLSDIAQLNSLINDAGGLNDQIAGLEAQLESTNAAYAVLEGELDSVQQQLANAEASISAYEGFLSDLDVGMSRLEKFLMDSYNYVPYQRSSLDIPTNMSERNPDFNNEEPNMLDAPDGSVYVGDGQPYQSVAYGNYLNNTSSNTTPTPIGPVEEFPTEGGFAGVQFAGNKKKQNKVSGFLSMMGKANHIKQGFSNFAGQEPFSRVDGDGDTGNGEEKTFELTNTAKSFLWLTGGAIAAFGIYKALKKK